MWDNIAGHRRQKEFLERYLQAEERPHAMLFSGAAGLGKRQLALEFASTLLCLNGKGGDSCESCRLFAGGGHSDFIQVDIEEGYKNIRIEQIKELTGKAAFAPVLSKFKVCIISDADKMTAEAANSFLKLLEEPPEGWVIILLAESADKMLSTILSRVICLRFYGLEAALLQKLLQDKGVPDGEAAVLALMSEGSPGTALALREQDVFEVRKQAAAFLEALPLKMPMNYLDGRAWLSYEAPQAMLFVRTLQLLLRDMLLGLAGAGKNFYNCDMQEELEELRRGWNIKGLQQALQAVNEAYAALAGSAGAKLVLEAAALKIDKLYKE